MEDEHTRVAIVPLRRKGETMEMFEESKDLKKTYSVRLGGGDNYPLRMEMVYCFFDIPLREAARIMRVSPSLLKRIRAWVNVDVWPCSLVHNTSSGFGLTRDQIIKGRDEVISGLEKECADCGGQSVELSLQIMKELKEYAAIYACLVIPGAGRRPSEKVAKRKRMEAISQMEKDRRTREIMESMQPRQRTLTVDSVAVMEDWPISIRQEFHLDSLLDVEDVLGLGPVSLTTTFWVGGF